MTNVGVTPVDPAVIEAFRQNSERDISRLQYLIELNRRVTAHITTIQDSTIFERAKQAWEFYRSYYWWDQMQNYPYKILVSYWGQSAVDLYGGMWELEKKNVFDMQAVQALIDKTAPKT